MPTSDLHSGYDPGVHRDYIRLPKRVDGEIPPPAQAPANARGVFPGRRYNLRSTDWPRCAPILESPWPQEQGKPCDGHGEPRTPARYAVWTDEDTGDGYRLSCAECLGGWVDAVTVRIR
jgi:hypothetical protein